MGHLDKGRIGQVADAHVSVPWYAWGGFSDRFSDPTPWTRRTKLKATVRSRRKSVVVVCIVVPIDLLHFFTGSAYNGPWPELVNGYLMDVLVPLAFYLLLCLPEIPQLQPWPVKALLVFGAAASVEVAQFFGVPILGRTFDPLGFVMYGLGVGLAVLLDTVVLPRLFEFWTDESSALA
jgi:hypothetical protein